MLPPTIIFFNHIYIYIFTQVWNEVPPTSNGLGKEQGKSWVSKCDPSDSSEHHRCTHVDVYDKNVTKDTDANLNNNVIQPCHHKN